MNPDREPLPISALAGGLGGAAAPILTVAQLEDQLSTPPPAVIETFRGLEGDVLILGAGGKMGPTLARMAARAAQEADVGTRIYAASRFPDRRLRDRLVDWGITALVCDLTQPGAISRLPHCSYMVYMAGRKFGSTGSEWDTWAANVYLPGDVARAFPRTRIVAFSTGNVYPFWQVPPVGADVDGPDEETPLDPIGEYAQSCLGRERMFEYFSRRNATLVTLLRLNYAVELRYGILVDLATKIWVGEPIDLGMAMANIIWQGDANAYALQCFDLCSTPPAILNVTGPPIRIRDVATRLAHKMDRPIRFRGTEGPTALLSNPAHCYARFGPPRTSLETMIDWVAHWVSHDGPTLNKPTHYDVRSGRF
jgi:hypothetical protein